MDLPYRPYRRPCSEASRFTVERCGPEAAPGAKHAGTTTFRDAPRRPAIRAYPDKKKTQQSYGTLLRVAANLTLFCLQHGLDRFLFHELFRASDGLNRTSASKIGSKPNI